MRGTVGKRVLASGRIDWYYSYDAGVDENGKRHRPFKGGFARKSEASAALLQALREIEDGRFVRPSPKTCAQFMEEWFNNHALPNCAPKTVERYRQLSEYFLPILGHVELKNISAFMLERTYAKLMHEGGRRKRRLKVGEEPSKAPLSPRTVRHVAGLIHSALSTAVRWKLLKLNPATACQLPRSENKEALALDEDQTNWYVESAAGDWLYPILVLAAATGCRRGELLALTWFDVQHDISPAAIRITKSLEQTKGGLRVKPPKSNKPRSVSIGSFAVETLKKHRADQDVVRAHFGNDYRHDLNLVFAAPDGTYLKPDSVTAKACLLAKRVGLKGVGLHSLRHSHGSHLLAKGVALPVVSKRLGHSNVAVTAKVYSHAFTRDEIAAGDIWDQSMRDVRDKPLIRN